MTLSIAGNIDTDEVLAICDEMLRPCEDKKLETFFPDEPDEIVQSEIYEKQPVGASIFHLGYKCRPCNDSERLKKIMQATIAVSMITDPSTEMYMELISNGVINSSFGGEVFSGDGYFTVIFSGESAKPDVIKKSIIEQTKDIINNGIDKELFSRIKKSTYGSLIRQLNNVSAVANLMINNHMDGIKPYDILDSLSEITYDDIHDFIKSELLTDKLVLSVIERSED